MNGQTSLTRARLCVSTITQGPLELDANQAHYIYRVLRLREGDELTLLGDDGTVALARIAPESRSDQVILEVGEPQTQPQLNREVTLAMAVAKGDRTDWAIEKLTELGVTRIVLMTTNRSVVVPRSLGNKHERWRRLAEAAARQSGRSRLPTIDGPLTFDECLAITAQHRFIGDGGGHPLTHLCRPPFDGSVLLLVGPEGGFTAEK